MGVLFFIGFGATVPPMVSDDPLAVAPAPAIEAPTAPEPAAETETAEVPAPETTNALEDDGKQPKRLEFIRTAIDNGVFMKVERTTLYPRLYIDAGFYMLPFDDKEGFVDVVLTYYLIEDPKADILIIRDGYTGNDIGRFSRFGLEMF